jgi:hypothetical protein
MKVAMLAAHLAFMTVALFTGRAFMAVLRNSRRDLVLTIARFSLNESPGTDADLQCGRTFCSGNHLLAPQRRRDVPYWRGIAACKLAMDHFGIMPTNKVLMATELAACLGVFHPLSGDDQSRDAN